MVEHLAGWADDRTVSALTLTTYRHVPWDGPNYETLGFSWLPSDRVTVGLHALRAEEADRGLDRWPRGCMRRDLEETRGRLAGRGPGQAATDDSDGA